MGDPIEVEADDNSNEIQGLGPSQVRVVTLRLRGLRWSQIAQTLGVTPWTIWRWRQVYPIDRIIAGEVNDTLEATKHRLLALRAQALRSLSHQMRRPDPEGGPIALQAAKIALEVSDRQMGNDRRGPIAELEGMTDAALDAALDAVPELGPGNDNGTEP